MGNGTRIWWQKYRVPFLMSGCTCMPTVQT
jgi:hypothetical protein